MTTIVKHIDPDVQQAVNEENADLEQEYAYQAANGIQCERLLHDAQLVQAAINWVEKADPEKQAVISYRESRNEWYVDGMLPPVYYKRGSEARNAASLIFTILRRRGTRPCEIQSTGDRWYRPC